MMAGPQTHAVLMAVRAVFLPHLAESANPGSFALFMGGN